MIIFHYKNVRVQNILNMDEVNASWNENICKLIYKNMSLEIPPQYYKIPYDNKYNI